MNWRHGIHPNNYAIGETEKYYSDMSEKGWELVKCGITLSRFQKTEPKKMRYRVEVVNLKSLEDGHLPEEQIAVYEDCRLGVCHQPRIPAHFPCTGRK